MEILTIIFTGVTATTAIASIIIASRNLKTSTDIAKAELFLHLQTEYLSIQEELNLKYRDPNWQPKYNTKDWKIIEKYWYHCFREWYVTKEINNGKFIGLWDNFFEEAIFHSLTHKPLVIVLKYLVDGGSSFSGQVKNFRSELENLYWQRTSEDLF